MRVILMMLLFITTFYANNHELTPEEKEWIQNNEVIIGVEQWYPITFTNKENQLDGLIGDIFKEVAKKYNIQYKVTTDEWHLILKKLKQGKIHLIPAAFYTKERTQFALYSSVVHKSKDYIYVINTNNKINGLADLTNKKLAIIKNYGTIPKIKEKFPSINIVETKDLQHSIDLVLEGKADALYDSQVVVEQYLLNNLITGLKSIKQNSFEASNLHIITNKNHKILHSILEKGLRSISKQQRMQIIKKWLHEKIKEKKSILTNDEINYINRRNSITYCIDPNWMPFEEIDNGKHIGISSDFIKLFEKELNIPFNLVPTKNWSQTLEYIQNKKCDFLPLTMQTNERSKYLNFTNSYLNVPLILVTKESIPFITSFEELNGKKIGIPKDFAFNEIIRNNFPKIDVVDVNNLYDGLIEVERGGLFGQISTNITTAYEFEKNFHKSLKISGHFNKNWDLSIAVNKDDITLINILNKLLTNVTEEHKHQILKKWVSNIQYEVITSYVLVSKVVIAILIIFLFFLYNHLLLKKHHKELQKAKKEVDNVNKSLEVKVKKRTLELEKLNENLDKKVKQEVEKREDQQKLLIEQSRMADMGTMLSMIAHQWRQPLSALGTIVQNIHLTNNMGKLNQTFLDEQLQLSNALTEKMSKTIDDFRYFFKPNKEKHDFSLHDSIQQTLYLVNTSLKNSEIAIQDESIHDEIIYGFGNEFSQVLLNIINNAKDALIERNTVNPTITIKTDTCTNCIKLKISDNAGGIKEEDIPNIFDPYFTTKDKHNGTGLGLYMCKMIVEDNMKGRISVHNSKEGAEFIIIIPTKDNIHCTATEKKCTFYDS